MRGYSTSESIISVLCTSGYEPSILYIRILSHRTGAMPNFGECGFYDIGPIDAATKSALRVPRMHGGGPGEGAEASPAAGGGEEGARRSWWRECSKDDGS